MHRLASRDKLMSREGIPVEGVACVPARWSLSATTLPGRTPATTTMPPCDEAVGPRVDSSCRSFDFTLHFEDLLFSIAPNAVLLVLVAQPVARLLRAQTIVKRTKAVTFKAVRPSVVSLSTCKLILLHLGTLFRPFSMSDYLSRPQIAATPAGHPYFHRGGCACYSEHHRRRQSLLAPASPFRATLSTTGHLLCHHFPAEHSTRQEPVAGT